MNLISVGRHYILITDFSILSENKVTPIITIIINYIQLCTMNRLLCIIAKGCLPSSSMIATVVCRHKSFEMRHAFKVKCSVSSVRSLSVIVIGIFIMD